MQAERDRIFDALHIGVITPHEAEEMAADVGLPPLRNVPREDEFDPMLEAWWTLPMVVAWMVWRNARAVRLQFDPYRSAAPYWFYQTFRSPSFVGGGWFLTQQEPATLLDLTLREAYQIAQATDEPMEMSIGAAQCELSRRASRGQIAASAQRVSDNAVVEIGANEWPYLQFYFSQRGPDELRYQHDALNGLYSRIRIKAADVLGLWPATALKVISRKEGQAGFRDWLSACVHQSPGKPTLTKQEAIGQAKEQFGLPGKAGLSLWKEVVASAPAWSKPGPRTGNRSRDRMQE